MAKEESTRRLCKSTTNAWKYEQKHWDLDLLKSHQHCTTLDLRITTEESTRRLCRSTTNAWKYEQKHWDLHQFKSHQHWTTLGLCIKTEESTRKLCRSTTNAWKYKQKHWDLHQFKSLKHWTTFSWRKRSWVRSEWPCKIESMRFPSSDFIPRIEIRLQNNCPHT